MVINTKKVIDVMPRGEVGAEPRARSISIPLRGGQGDEEIVINCDEMPSGDDVIEILQREQAPLRIWIEVGLEYYRQSELDAFMRILEMSGHEAGLNYPDVEDDQMRALDMLAAYYVHKGHKERTSREKRTELFNKATILFTTADRIKMYDTRHLTGRAWFCLLEGKNSKLDQADQQFNFVIKQNSNDIPAMLGKACIAFNTKDYKNALYYYKKALQQKPDGPADFRVGLGYCYARMGNLAKARQAFERALEISEENVPALVSLAILDQNAQEIQPQKDEQSMEEKLASSIARLSLAYKLEPENPVVLIHLANHFFFKGDLSKVEQLAWHALQIADNSSIKAEACYQLARVFHSEKTYDKAFRYYYQATTLEPNFILAHFGLGQLYIYRNELNNAITSFETVSKHYPNNVETLKILGSLYAHSDPKNQERRQKAREAFQKLLKFCPDDIEGLIDLAQLLENTEPAKSLEYYEKSIELLRDVEGVDPQPEMVNNIGALHMQLGNYGRARDFFEEAQRILEGSIARGDSVSDSNMMVTIRYNLARCLEQLCLYNDAESVYKSILVQHQNYVDCYMRLGCICRDRGQLYDSSIWFKQAIPYDEVSADAWTLIANLHMSKNEWLPTQKKFEMIITKGTGSNKMNAYAHVALGNVWLEQLFNPARKREDDGKNLERAQLMYTKALKLQPKNIWAANGIGCILAVKRQWDEARECFSMVRELTADFPDVWFNIAHVYMEMGQFVPAIQMYTNAMKKFKRENDVLYNIYLARAFCRANKMEECRETLEKALIEAPDNVQVKTNYAMVLKRISKISLENAKATAKQVKGSIEDLKIAERILLYVAQNKDDSVSGAKYVSKRFAADVARACSDMLRQAETSYLANAITRDEEEARLREQQEEARRALKKKMEEEAAEREAEAQRRLEEMKALRESYMMMTKDILKLPEIKEDAKSRGGGRKKRGGDDEFVNDSSDAGEWQGEDGLEGEGQEARQRARKDKAAKRASRKRREKKAGAGSSDEERGGPSKKKRKERPKEDHKLSAKQSAKIKSRAFLSSESSSSEDEKKKSTTTKAASSDSDSDRVEGEDRAGGRESGGESSEPPIIGKSSSDSDNNDSDESAPSKRKKKPMASDGDSDSDEAMPSAAGSLRSSSDSESGRRKAATSSSPRKRTAAIISDSDSD